MVRGALSEQEFEERKASIDRNATLVPYCTVGYRSGLLCSRLAEEGFEHLYNGQGVVLWSFSDLEFVRRNEEGEEEQTNRVHVYGEKWDRIDEERYEIVVFSTWNQVKEGVKEWMK